VRDSWGALHSQLPRPTAFLSVPWVESWLQIYGPALDPLVWTATVSGTVVGAALLVPRTERRGGIPLRCLYLNTAGEGEDSPTVEHNTVLAAHGHEDAVWQTIGATLRGLDWDELRLSGVDTQTADRFRALFPDWDSSLEARVAPYIPLAPLLESAEGLLATLSANTRSQLRRAARIAGERGPLSLEEATTPALRASIWGDLQLLHTARWRTRGQAGVFSRPRWRAFHEQLMTASPCCARLFRLRVGEEPVAAVYLLQHGGHVAFYQSGLAPRADDNRDKPGLLIQQMVIEQLATEGGIEYDLLASEGPELRYKRSLAGSERTLWWGEVVRPTVRSHLVRQLRALRTRWRARSGWLTAR
jgi:hypothetical protein